jgi:5-(carboxyamino)imidazole ribonucleotide synthase
MENILGSTHQDLLDVVDEAMAIDDRAKIDLYNKGIRAGRKLGHVNITASDMKKTLKTIRLITNLFQNTTEDSEEAELIEKTKRKTGRNDTMKNSC